MIVSVSSSHFGSPTSILPYPALNLPTITPSPYSPSPLLLHDQFLSLRYKDMDAPTIALIVKVQIPLRHQTQVHDRTSCNVLRDRFMVASDIHLDLIKPHCFQRHSNGWLYPCSIPLTFGSHTRHPPYRPGVEPLEGLIQLGVHYPRL